MSDQIATVASPDTLSLSPEAQEALGLHAGSRLSVTIEQGKVTLKPYAEPEPPLSKAEVDEIIAEMQGMFKGQPSLEDEYFRDRDKDKW